MKISQYVYFDVCSQTVPAATVTACLGLEPDDFRVLGSRRTAPRLSPAHCWRIHCRDRGLSLDAQIGRVLDRLISARAELLELIDSHDVKTRLIIVRYFNDEDGEEEEFEAAITEDGELLERLPGQHQLLGWGLTLDQMAFLAAIRASIWADEYG